MSFLDNMQLGAYFQDFEHLAAYSGLSCALMPPPVMCAAAPPLPPPMMMGGMPPPPPSMMRHTGAPPMPMLGMQMATPTIGMDVVDCAADPMDLMDLCDDEDESDFDTLDSFSRMTCLTTFHFLLPRFASFRFICLFFSD